MFRPIHVVGLLAALVLGGCMSTEDEIFSLDNTTVLPLEGGIYDCDDILAPTARVVVVHRGPGRAPEYHLLGENEFMVSRSAFYKIANDLYLMANAHRDDPGENVFAIRIRENAFKMIKHDEKVLDKPLMNLAKKHGVVVTNEKAGWRLTGDLDKQRAYLLAYVRLVGNQQDGVECVRRVKEKQPDEE